MIVKGNKSNSIQQWRKATGQMKQEGMTSEETQKDKEEAAERQVSVAVKS